MKANVVGQAGSKKQQGTWLFGIYVCLTTCCQLRLLLAAAASTGGMSASHLDIAPRHAGVVFGLGNTAGTLAGLVAVPAMGCVLQTLHSWPITFGIAAVHNIVGAVIWSQWAGDKPLPEDGSAQETAVAVVQQQVVMSEAAAMWSSAKRGSGQEGRSVEDNQSSRMLEPVFVGAVGAAA